MSIMNTDAQDKRHQPVTQELIAYMKEDEGLKKLFETSIRKGISVNPDPDTNPIRNIEDYLDLIDRCLMALPWTFSPSGKYSSLYIM